MKKNNSNKAGWPGDEERRADAAYNFCKALDEDSDLRSRCLDKDLPDARDTFKEEGQYGNMPEDVIVRAFEIEDEDRGDRLITIKLPPVGKLPPKDQFIAKKYWVCTYNHWDTLKSNK